MQMYLSMKRLSQQKMSNKRMIIFILHLSKLRALRLQANAKRLILTHISSRYQGDTYKELLKEARELFSNTEIATDLKSFPVENNNFVKNGNGGLPFFMSKNLKIKLLLFYTYTWMVQKIRMV